MMMLACAQLRVVPVTVHVSLAAAARTLSSDKIIRCGRVTEEALKRDFTVAKPRLAVSGLNPHGSEKGGVGLKRGGEALAGLTGRLAQAKKKSSSQTVW